MSEPCALCRPRPGWSGYISYIGDGVVELPCRCVLEESDRELYGSTEKKMEFLRALQL